MIVDGHRIAGLEAHPWQGPPSGDDWARAVGRIAEACPQIAELDLSRSLLDRWVDVYGICEALPSLRRLALKSVLQLKVEKLH